MPLPFSHPIFDIQNTTGIDKDPAKKPGRCTLNLTDSHAAATKCHKMQ